MGRCKSHQKKIGPSVRVKQKRRSGLAPTEREIEQRLEKVNRISADAQSGER